MYLFADIRLSALVEGIILYMSVNTPQLAIWKLVSQIASVVEASTVRFILLKLSWKYSQGLVTCYYHIDKSFHKQVRLKYCTLLER